MKGSCVQKSFQCTSTAIFVERAKITDMGRRSGGKRNHNFAVSRRKLTCLHFFGGVNDTQGRSQAEIFFWGGHLAKKTMSEGGRLLTSSYISCNIGGGLSFIC